MSASTKSRDASTDKSYDLNSEVLSTFRNTCNFVIKPNDSELHTSTSYSGNYIDGNISSLSFHRSGDWLMASTNNNHSYLFDCISGEMKSSFQSPCSFSHVCFTAHANAFIAASGDNKGSLQYISWFDHQVLREFRGYSGQTRSLCVSNSMHDTFVTSSSDKTIKFWDLRSPMCQSLVNCETPVLVSCDPQSSVIAVASANNTIQLLDQRSLDAGAFATFTMSGPILDFTHLEFGLDGAAIAVCGTVSRSNPNAEDIDKQSVVLIDSFEGKTLSSYQIPTKTAMSGAVKEALGLEAQKPQKEGKNKVAFKPHASISPNAAFVSSGTSYGRVLTHHIESGDETTALLHENQTPVTHVQWNPRRLLLASVDTHELALWTPTI